MIEILTDRKFIKKAIEIVSKAEYSIDICTFKAELSHSRAGLIMLPFWDEVFKKCKEQKKVRFLINYNTKRHSTPKTNILVMNKIKEQNAQVFTLCNDRICHSKLIIVDKKFAIVGSHNLANKSITENYETSIFTDDISAISLLCQDLDSTLISAKKF